jgi:hypothetical protein
MDLTLREGYWIIVVSNFMYSGVSTVGLKIAFLLLLMKSRTEYSCDT